MITLEQVRLLEQRVQKIVQRLSELQSENTSLREEVHQLRASEGALKERIATFDATQAEIESGILSALHRLDEVEDAVAEGDAESRRIVVETPADSEGDAPEAAAEQEEAETPDETETSDETELQEDADETEQGGPELDIF